MEKMKMCHMCFEDCDLSRDKVEIISEDECSEKEEVEE